MNILTRPWRHIFDYKGRSTRREFWLFIVLFYGVMFLFGAAIVTVFAVMGTRLDPDSAEFSDLVGLIPAFWTLACLPAFLAVSVRRLHDHDKSGWFLLISWFPVFGWVFFLIMMLTPGTEEDNSYGPNPRYKDPHGDTAEIFA